MNSTWRPLHPFNLAEAGVITLEARIEKAPDGLHLHYRLRAPSSDLLAALLPPQSESSRRTDGLWKTTCFEAFLGVKNSSAYFEFNASPSGDWAWYAFEAERRGMRASALAKEGEPREISHRRDATSLAVEWLIPTSALEGKAIADASLTAVLDQAGELTYWAMKHAGAEPDFHRRDSFIGFRS